MNAIVEDFKWGGLYRRYKYFHGGAYRAIDPVDGVRVSFAKPVLFENWLLRRFDPSIGEIVIRPSIVSGPPGDAINETPDLDIYFVDGHREFDQVTGTRLEEARAIRLRKLAAYCDCDHNLRTSAEIRRDTRLIQSLRYLRQAMTAHARSTETVMGVVMKVMTTRERATVGDLRAKLVDFADDQIDAALGHMHIAGLIRLQLTGAHYGRDIVVLAV